MSLLSTLGKGLAVTGEGVRLHHAGRLGKFIAALSVLMTLVIAWYALYMPVSEHKQVSYFLALIFPIGFLTTTISKSFQRLTWLDYLLAFVSFVTGAWYALNEQKYQNWMRGFSELDAYDVAAGDCGHRPRDRAMPARHRLGPDLDRDFPPAACRMGPADLRQLLTMTRSRCSISSTCRRWAPTEFLAARSMSPPATPSCSCSSAASTASPAAANCCSIWRPRSPAAWSAVRPRPVSSRARSMAPCRAARWPTSPPPARSTSRS